MVLIKFDKKFDNISLILRHARPFCMYLRVFGVFPYKLQPNGIEVSCWGAIQTVNLIIFTCWGISHFFQGDPFDEPLSKFEQAQFVTCALIGLLRFLSQYKKFKKCMSTALIIGNEILVPSETISGVIKLQLCEFFVSTVFIAYLHFAPIALSIILLNIWLNLTNKLYFFFFFFSNIMYLVECIFVNFLYFITECFRSVNNEIATLAVHKSRVIPDIKHPEMLTHNLDTAASMKHIISKLSRLFMIHADLCDLVADLNTMFSIHVVFLIERNSYTNEQTIFQIYLIIWGVLHCIRFQMFCRACDAVKTETHRTGVDIHRVINSTTSEILRDKHITDLTLSMCEGAWGLIVDVRKKEKQVMLAPWVGKTGGRSGDSGILVFLLVSPLAAAAVGIVTHDLCFRRNILK
ncbi:hypothetical protein CBL_03223 [Carabus blaptoides fortunei]